MTVERVCGCGCGASLEDRNRKALYASDACRARGWKARTGYGPQRPRKDRANGRSRQRQPELRVSYRKTVDHLANWLEAGGEPPAMARRHAEQVIGAALTPHQRDALARIRAREGGR